MAYIDDNNENLPRKGDPLEELDSELAQLKATLGELEANHEEAEASVPAVSEIPEQPANAPMPEQPKADSRHEPEVSDTDDIMKKQSKKPAHISGGKKPNTVIIIAVIAAVILALCAGGALIFSGLNKLNQNNSGSTTATSGGESVTISDSVMGDIELQTVKGAEINTKTQDNLKTDENGIPAYYQDGTKISHLGIDLSEFQGEVDFEKVKESGVEFVMLRIGGRYYGTDGGLYEDKAFDTYYEQAKAAGLKVGAYFFSQAASVEDAKEEAQYSVSKLNGRKLDYPIAFDWENIGDDEARTDNVTGDQLTLIAEAFCDTVISAGFKAIVYSNTAQMFVMYDFETMKDYDFWLADYREFPTMYYNYDMWQYSTDGSVSGIEGKVDMNLCFTDFAE